MDPVREGYGVEQFINLLLAVLDMYLRHKPEIDKFITSDHANIFTQLASDRNSLAAVNPPGPNVTPAHEGL